MSLSFSANLGSFDSLNVRMRWGGELMGLEDALHRSQTHARRLRQHPAGPMAGFSRRRRERQIDHSLHRGRRQRRLASSTPSDRPPRSFGSGDCTEGVANSFSFRLDFLVRKSVYAAHQRRWSRSPSSQLECRSARGHRAGQITRHDVAALFLDQGGANGLRRAVRIRDQECGN
jgi:hypothetical protein